MLKIIQKLFKIINSIKSMLFWINFFQVIFLIKRKMNSNIFKVKEIFKGKELTYDNVIGLK